MLLRRRSVTAARKPIAGSGTESGSESALQGYQSEEAQTMKILLWIVGIIFLIGLLVVFGVIDLIF